MNNLEVIVNTTKKIDLFMLKERIGKSNFFVMNYSGSTYCELEIPSGLTVMDFQAGGSMADNWNKTINSCAKINSDYFCFFHDDDIYNSEIYTYYAKTIQEHKPDIIYSECEFVTHNGFRRYIKEFIYKRHIIRKNQAITAENLIRSIFHKGFFIRTPSLCFSRSLINKIYFEDKYGPFLDFSFITLLPSSTKIYLIAKKLFKYVDSSESQTQLTVSLKKIAQEKMLYR